MRVHLARFLRPKTFTQVVGQELALRMLKNMLFRQTIFPSYIFAGQRGTGKTTVGRLFAAAINCQQLPLFVQNPREVQIPCATCPECLAVIDLAHPDVHEIDAASHTGVDAMRTLLEHVPFLPVQGRKKIYLIDEAHMLSKAAFNACLKVFEEPPEHVVFILATTDLHKILETVASRCFHVYFDPLAQVQVSAYIEQVARQEGLTCAPDAAQEIARATHGSLREALTLLERVGLVDTHITRDTVLLVTGSVSKDAMAQLIESVRGGAYQEVYRVCAERAGTDGQALWRACKEYYQQDFYACLQANNTQGQAEASRKLRQLAQEETRWARSRDPQELAYFLWTLEHVFTDTQPVAVSSPVTTRPRRETASQATASQVTVPVSDAPASSSPVQTARTLLSTHEPFVQAALVHAHIEIVQGVLQVSVANDHLFLQEWIEKAVQASAQKLAQQYPEISAQGRVVWHKKTDGTRAHNTPERRTVSQSSPPEQPRRAARADTSAIPPEVRQLLQVFPGTITKDEP